MLSHATATIAALFFSTLPTPIGARKAASQWNSQRSSDNASSAPAELQRYSIPPLELPPPKLGVNVQAERDGTYSASFPPPPPAAAPPPNSPPQPTFPLGPHSAEEPPPRAPPAPPPGARDTPEVTYYSGVFAAPSAPPASGVILRLLGQKKAVLLQSPFFLYLEIKFGPSG